MYPVSPHNCLYAKAALLTSALYRTLQYREGIKLMKFKQIFSISYYLSPIGTVVQAIEFDWKLLVMSLKNETYLKKI